MERGVSINTRINKPLSSTVFYVSFCILLVFNSTHVVAQNTTSGNYFSFKTQFMQIKDEFNYGLVFSGLNLDAGYIRVIQWDQYMVAFSSELGFGPNFSKGIGLAWNFKPVDIYYGFRTSLGDLGVLYLGPYVSFNYFWQLYPELQSGHLFWFSSIEMGPGVQFSMPVGERSLQVTLKNSLGGMISRPEPSTETYYYSLKISDFYKNAHKDMELGSYGTINHTDLEISVSDPAKKKMKVSYQFIFYSYSKSPAFRYQVHGFNLNWRIGNGE